MPPHDELAARLLNENVLVPLLFFAGILLIVLMKTVASIMKTSAREQSRREIAAFIAEGSISPEQGERLIKAEPKN